MGTLAAILIILTIAVVAFLAMRLWKRRQIRRALQSMGLDAQEMSLFQQELNNRDQPAMLRRLALAQERQRERFQSATGVDPRNITPEVGREISWADIVRHVFRVMEFDRSDTTLGPDNQVRASSLFTPYGYLLVESPTLNQPIRLPIIHRDDFWLAASVFDEPTLADLVDTEELLVTYAPRKVLPGGFSGEPSHVLHYVITPKGTLDHYYSKDNDLHMALPNPDLLFDKFVYDGEIRVGINSNPNL